MEIGKTKLALTASALAMALMLAGCGGSSSSGGVSSAGTAGTSTPPATTPSTQEQLDAEKQKAADAEKARQEAEGEKRAAEQVTNLFRQANDAETAAEDAGEMATEALATAKKMAGMLDVISVAGNSMAAMNNAQAILDAKAKVATELANAQKALADAMAAQTAANALPADTPELASLIGEDGEGGEIGEAIKAANKAIADIKEMQADKGPTTLAGYVYAVEGAGGTGTPTKTGEGIAKMIGEAFATLSGQSDDTAEDRVKHSTGSGADAENPLPPTKAMSINAAGDGNTMNLPRRPPFPGHDAPATAMTWAEIVGSTVPRQIDETSETKTRTVHVASVAGTALTLIGGAAVTNGELSADVTNDGQETAASSWRGIMGTLICGGTDCEVESGKLTGSWYFTPSDVDQRYTRAANSDTYKAYDLYATYGYWLSHATGGLVTVNTYAGQSDGRAAVTPGVVDRTPVGTPAAALPDGTATYEGQAIGMSMMKSFDPVTSKEMGHKSGEFTAMVTLTAEFNNSPKLSGTINGFSGVGASSDWSVTLQEESLTTAGVLGATGIAQGSGTTNPAAGTWTANTYGDTGKRPTGIFGGFNAHFDNGHAAGAYATRMKQ